MSSQLEPISARLVELGPLSLAPDSLAADTLVRAANSIRDEIFWSPYADLGCSLGYFISVLQALKDNSSDTHW